MNGLYGRSMQVPSWVSGEFQLGYVHDFTGWFMGLATATEEVRSKTGKNTEWQLIDNDGAIRFRHDGDTLIPGAGERWSHVHRVTNGGEGEGGDAEGAERRATGTSVAAAVEDDLEELPWQVVGIGADNMYDKLKRYFQFYKHNVQRAIAGETLPPMPHVPRGGSDEQSPPADLKLPAELADEEDDLCDGGTAKESARVAAAAATKSGERWVAAVLYFRVARDCRYGRHLGEASMWIGEALQFFPRYKEALFERGLLYLDQGRYVDAIASFATLLRVDRNWPAMDRWLVLASAHEERKKAFAEEIKQGLDAQQTAHCVAWRQTGGCDPAGPRESDADRGCSALVETGVSGFCECKGAIGNAAESVCGHERFTCAEACEQRFKSLGEAASLEDSSSGPSPRQAEADPCASEGAPTWCSPDHYFVLGIRSDFPDPENPEEGEAEELRRTYKKRSLQVHPDKAGGSVRAFQRVAEAHEVLADPARRRKFDEGDELPRERQQDGSEGPSLRTRIEKQYFPERFDFEPFGDPHTDRRERQSQEQRRLERQRQEALARGEHVKSSDSGRQSDEL